MKKVLITGAAGFIGSHLCDRFIKEGFYVIGLDSFLTGSPDNIAHLISNERFKFIGLSSSPDQSLSESLIDDQIH